MCRDSQRQYLKTSKVNKIGFFSRVLCRNRHRQPFDSPKQPKAQQPYTYTTRMMFMMKRIVLPKDRQPWTLIMATVLLLATSAVFVLVQRHDALQVAVLRGDLRNAERVHRNILTKTKQIVQQTKDMQLEMKQLQQENEQLMQIINDAEGEQRGATIVQQPPPLQTQTQKLAETPALSEREQAYLSRIDDLSSQITSWNKDMMQREFGNTFPTFTITCQVVGNDVGGIAAVASTTTTTTTASTSFQWDPSKEEQQQEEEEEEEPQQPPGITFQLRFAHAQYFPNEMASLVQMVKTGEWRGLQLHFVRSVHEAATSAFANHDEAAASEEETTTIVLESLARPQGLSEWPTKHAISLQVKQGAWFVLAHQAQHHAALLETMTSGGSSSSSSTGNYETVSSAPKHLAQIMQGTEWLEDFIESSAQRFSVEVVAMNRIYSSSQKSS